MSCGMLLRVTPTEYFSLPYLYLLYIHTQTRGANKLWGSAQSDSNRILLVAVSVFTVYTYPD